jgi:flagellar L-ring protein precursor FlgH
MSGKPRLVRWFSIVILGSALVPRLAAGQTAPAPPKHAPAPTVSRPPAKTYDELYQQYLDAARNTAQPAGLWMADLAVDRTARRLNDLVTIRVIESVSGAGSADSTVNKKGSGDISVPLPTQWWDWTLGKVVPFSSETMFNGSGGTTRSTELSATVTARVMEVLPNGDLVVQGVREVNVNGDRNLVVLNGVIRPNDVMPGNVIPSSRVGQLQISSLSQGLIHDSLSPGYLIRLLNKVF